MRKAQRAQKRRPLTQKVQEAQGGSGIEVIDPESRWDRTFAQRSQGGPGGPGLAQGSPGRLTKLSMSASSASSASYNRYVFTEIRAFRRAARALKISNLKLANSSIFEHVINLIK